MCIRITALLSVCIKAISFPSTRQLLQPLPRGRRNCGIWGGRRGGGSEGEWREGKGDHCPTTWNINLPPLPHRITQATNNVKICHPADRKNYDEEWTKSADNILSCGCCFHGRCGPWNGQRKRLAKWKKLVSITKIDSQMGIRNVHQMNGEVERWAKFKLIAQCIFIIGNNYYATIYCEKIYIWGHFFWACLCHW